jgi:hypothetical protein
MPAMDKDGNELKYGQGVTITEAQTRGMLGLELPDDDDANIIMVERGSSGIVCWIPHAAKNPFLVEVYASYYTTREHTHYIQTKHLKGQDVMLSDRIPQRIQDLNAGKAVIPR